LIGQGSAPKNLTIPFFPSAPPNSQMNHLPNTRNPTLLSGSSLSLIDHGLFMLGSLCE